MKSNIYQHIRKKYPEFVIDFSKIYNATIINIENIINIPNLTKIDGDREEILSYLYKLIDTEQYNEINKTLHIHSNTLLKNDFFSLFKYSENKIKLLENKIKENKNLFWFLLLNFINFIFLSFFIWVLVFVFMFFDITKTIHIIFVVTVYILSIIIMFIEIRRKYPPIFVQKSQLNTLHKITHLFEELHLRIV